MADYIRRLVDDTSVRRLIPNVLPVGRVEVRRRRTAMVKWVERSVRRRLSVVRGKGHEIPSTYARVCEWRQCDSCKYPRKHFADTGWEWQSIGPFAHDFAHIAVATLLNRCVSVQIKVPLCACPGGVRRSKRERAPRPGVDHMHVRPRQRRMTVTNAGLHPSMEARTCTVYICICYGRATMQDIMHHALWTITRRSYITVALS